MHESEKYKKEGKSRRKTKPGKEEGFKASGRKDKGLMEPGNRRGEDSGGKEATDLEKPRGDPQGQLPQKGEKRTRRK